jgi:hypothetical protein
LGLTGSRTRTQWTVELDARIGPPSIRVVHQLGSGSLVRRGIDAGSGACLDEHLACVVDERSVAELGESVASLNGLGLHHQADAHDAPSCGEAPNAGELAIGQAG